jgi:hypothetical protein
VDVEGAEAEVLRTIDFATVTVDVFMLEKSRFVPEEDGRVARFIVERGYRKCRAVHVKRSAVFLRQASRVCTWPGARSPAQSCCRIRPQS